MPSLIDVSFAAIPNSGKPEVEIAERWSGYCDLEKHASNQWPHLGRVC